MKLNWITKIVSKIAEEVHKSKIDDFDEKVKDLISDHKAMKKTISSNEDRIKTLENRVFNAVIASSKMEATIQTVLLLKEREIEQLKLKK